MDNQPNSNQTPPQIPPVPQPQPYEPTIIAPSINRTETPMTSEVNPQPPEPAPLSAQYPPVASPSVSSPPIQAPAQPMPQPMTEALNTPPPPPPTMAGMPNTYQTPPPPIAPIVSQPIVDNDYQPAGVPVFATDALGSNTPPSNRKLKIGRRTAFAALGVILVVALTTGGVFGLYLPNTPSGAWKTGMSRSGKALAAVVSSATDHTTLDSYKKSAVNIGVTASGGGSSYSGTAKFLYDSSNLNGHVDFSGSGDFLGNAKLSADLLTTMPQNAEFPNVYFRLTGLKTLNIADYLGDYSKYDNQWIAISSDYWKSLGLTSADVKSQSNKLTAADVTEFAQAATGSINRYVLTADPKRAVIVKKSYVGKEQVDGVTAFHYKASLDADHAKLFCQDMVDSIVATKAYTHVPGYDAKTVSTDKQTAIKDCQQSVDDSFKRDTSFDMWIDAKYKLIHKIRVYDVNDSKSYTEYGQTYTGGDQFSLFMNSYSSNTKSTGKLSLTFNLKTAHTSGQWSIDEGTGSDAFHIKVTVDAQPYSGSVEVKPPTTSVPIQQIIGGGLGTTSSTNNSSGGLAVNARDTERETDIRSLQTQLESYFVDKGYYPSLAQFNSASWRATNMKSLDPAALKDPAGSTSVLAAKPTAHQYSYEVTNIDGNSCEADTTTCVEYTLTATYEDSTPYSVVNLD